MFSDYHHFQTFDGLRIRWGHSPAPQSSPCGTVVLLSGRTEYMEKYLETAADLNQRGWAVYSLDWRGQGLSERLMDNRLKGHVGRFRDYLDDLAQLIGLIQEDGAPPPWMLMAHSMGAHIGLRFLRERQHPFAGAVLISPMIDVQLPHVPRPLLCGLVQTLARLGFSRAYAPGMAAYANKDRIFSDNPFTNDPQRFKRRVDDITVNPQLALGGVTYGWLQAALSSIERLDAPDFARALTLPLLIARGTDERIVCLAAQARFCRQAPDCRRVDIPGGRHELLLETDARRRLLWQAIDRFTAAVFFETHVAKPPRPPNVHGTAD